jgi:hypothetical protein
MIINKKNRYEITNKPLKSSFKNFDFKGNGVIIMCFEEWNFKKKKKEPRALVKCCFDFKGILAI